MFIRWGKSKQEYGMSWRYRRERIADGRWLKLVRSGYFHDLMGSRKNGYQSIAKRLGLMRRRVISSSEKRELYKYSIGCFCSGGWKLKMTSARFSFLTEVGSKAILLNVMNQDPSYSLWSTHLEIIKTTLSGVVLLYLAERCGSSDSEQFSDFSKVT